MQLHFSSKDFEILEFDPPNNPTSHYGACHFGYNLALKGILIVLEVHPCYKVPEYLFDVIRIWINMLMMFQSLNFLAVLYNINISMKYRLSGLASHNKGDKGFKLC